MATLKELRLNQGLTQAQLAAKIHVSRASVTDWEVGRAKPRTLEKLLALANGLNCSLDAVVQALK